AGDQVSEFAVGDEVIAAKSCTLTSHLTLGSQFVAHKPSHLSLEQAATIPLAFLTAFYSLHTLARMDREESVLIHAGTGGLRLGRAGGGATRSACGGGRVRDGRLAREARAAHGARRAARDGLAQPRFRRRDPQAHQRRRRRYRAELAVRRGDRQEPVAAAA